MTTIKRCRHKGRANRRQKVLVKQRLMGVVLLFISAIVILIASGGQTIEDRDATVVLFTIPVGLYMLLAKDVIIIP